jgi:hypothetical protein
MSILGILLNILRQNVTLSGDEKDKLTLMSQEMSAMLSILNWLAGSL